jgi:hypothetical protein
MKMLSASLRIYFLTMSLLPCHVSYCKLCELGLNCAVNSSECGAAPHLSVVINSGLTKATFVLMLSVFRIIGRVELQWGFRE